jgi:alpha-D-xyloside xylohydrolase
VTEAGAVQREVLLPEGAWVGFWDGVTLEGPGPQTVSAPLGTLPLFLRAGALLPLLRPTIDTLAPTTRPELVDSFATSAGLLYVIVSAGPASTFDMYDGTLLSQRIGDEDGAPLLLTIEHGSVFTAGAVFEVVASGAEPPSRVVVGTTTLERASDLSALTSVGQGYAFDPQDRGGTLSIKVQPGDGVVSVRVEK